MHACRPNAIKQFAAGEAQAFGGLQATVLSPNMYCPILFCPPSASKKSMLICCSRQCSPQPPVVSYGHYPLGLTSFGVAPRLRGLDSVLSIMQKHGVVTFLSGHLHSSLGQRSHHVYRTPTHGAPTAGACGTHVQPSGSACWTVRHSSLAALVHAPAPCHLMYGTPGNFAVKQRNALHTDDEDMAPHQMCAAHHCHVDTRDQAPPQS